MLKILKVFVLLVYVLLSLCFEVDYYFPVAGKSVYV